MKITKQRLQQIIKEEVSRFYSVNEQDDIAEFEDFVRDYFGEDPRKVPDEEMNLMRRYFSTPEVRKNWDFLRGKSEPRLEEGCDGKEERPNFKDKHGEAYLEEEEVDESRRDKRFNRQQNKRLNKGQRA